MNVQKYTSEDERVDKVLFVITTDGMENASREYTANKIKNMIEHQKREIWMGLHVSRGGYWYISTAAHFGIDEDFAVDYHAENNIETKLNLIL